MKTKIIMAKRFIGAFLTVLIPSFGVAVFLPIEHRLFWIGGVFLGMFVGLLEQKKTTSYQVVSCAPTAKFFHTFSTKDQWSCDCGEIRKEPNS